jgi:hypothetical protein
MKDGLTIVCIQAVDWAMHHGQVAHDSGFEVVRGWISGFLVEETDEHIALTQQWFNSGDVRQTISIPKVCILNESRFEGVNKS